MTSLKTTCYLIALLIACPLMGRNVLLEFKGAYFLPTSCDFKNIYRHGGALFGPELTVQLCECKDWYVFTSFDYFQKKGHSVGLCDPTTVTLIPVALGLKYFLPAFDDRVDFYGGLGFEAVNVRTKSCSDNVITKLSQWGFGGIAKVGAYYYLPHCFVIDFFIDYSFVRVGSNDCNCGVQSVKANIGGAIFGVGIGYNF
jgi:hypothetical protein